MDFRIQVAGFKIGLHHSKETALFKVTNDLLTASNKRLISKLDIMDLSSAVDTTEHHILLQRLEHLIGIKGITLSWFTFCLSDQIKFVQINDKSSMYSKVSHGVSQGSLLATVLFTLYILPLYIILLANIS